MMVIEGNYLRLLPFFRLRFAELARQRRDRETQMSER